MSSLHLRLNPIRRAIVVLLGASLVACGGGGGGGDEPPPTLINLTTANMTTVAHAAAAAPFALGAAGSVATIADGGGTVTRLVGSIVPALARGMDGADGQARALAFYPGDPAACPHGGTVTVSVDDADDDGVFDVGDTMSFVFDQCRLSPAEVTHGRTDVTMTHVGGGPLPSFGARMTMHEMSALGVDGRHAVTTDGVAFLDYARLDAVRERMRLTVENELTARIRTHQGVDDTLGLQHGYTYESTFDGASGVSTTSLGGLFRSVAAGGLARARTDAAFQDHVSDAYPSTGALNVGGARGTLIVRAMSTEQVRLELDHDDCGTAEQVQTQSWDWLM